MSHFLRPASLLICTSAALLAVTACSHSKAQNNPPVDHGAAPAAVKVDLPLDRYMFNEFEIHDLSSLLRTYTLACMERYGYPDTKLPEPPDPGVSEHNERRYGITDGRLAERLGYRVATRSDAARTPDATLSEDEEFTLTGGSEKPGEAGKGGTNEKGTKVPPGGCTGEALKALGYAPTAVPGNPSLVQDLNQQSFEASGQADGVERALKNWSTCMRDRGYTYAAEPFSASNDPKFTTPTVTTAEKEVATADVECKKSSGLIDTWQAEESNIQRSLIAEHQQELQKVAKQRDVTLSLIKELSGSSS